MKSRVSVFGLGYVGSVTAACLASQGNCVLGVDINAAKVEQLQEGRSLLVKQLLGEGREVKIWDDTLSLGRLVGSNRDYIENTIPHIGSLLCQILADALRSSEVVVIGTRGIQRDELQRHLRPDHLVLDLVNLERSRRPVLSGEYQGICW